MMTLEAEDGTIYPLEPMTTDELYALLRERFLWRTVRHPRAGTAEAMAWCLQHYPRMHTSGVRWHLSQEARSVFREIVRQQHAAHGSWRWRRSQYRAAEWRAFEQAWRAAQHRGGGV